MNFVNLKTPSAGGIATVAPISLGIVNLFIFFLSPLFFLTQLVQGRFVESTVRVLLEMLWARLLYAVFVLAYILTAVLQGPAWKSVLGTVGFTAGGTMLVLARRMASMVLAGGGAATLAMVAGYLTLTLAAGMITLWFGAQMLRTLIFGEYMHLTQVIDSGKEIIRQRVKFGKAPTKS